MKPDLNNYDAVIFDLFHTLISLDDTAGVFRMAREYLGIPRDLWNEALFSDADNRLRGRITQPPDVIRDIVEKVGASITEDNIQTAAALRLRQFEGALTHVRPNVLGAISRLKESGKALGLISNADKTEVSAWPNTAVSAHFDFALFSCDVGFVKPEMEIYLLALQRLRVAPGRCLFIGDGGNDELAGAKDAGMDTAITLEFVADPESDAMRHRRRQADYEISGISELA